MATLLLIDADGGIDDAVAVSLALTSAALDLRAVVGVGGCVEVEQTMRNLGGLLRALDPPQRPILGRGLDPEGPALDRRGGFGADGFGECGVPLDEAPAARDFREVYRETIEQAGGGLVVMTTGPLTNLAAVLADLPELARQVRHVYITGGALWTAGDVAEGVAEFNFRRDAAAAERVLSSGLPITIVPLDVTKMVCVDESHVARLAAGGYRTGDVLGRLMAYPLEQDAPPGYGKSYIHAGVAAAGAIWPKLFVKTRMGVQVSASGRDAGRCRPTLGGDKSRHVDVLTATNAVDLIENMLESLNHEAFIV
jgi:inosine-uridine nucleoside N-ribohydrolase